MISATAVTALVITALTWLFARGITVPRQRLIGTTRQIAEGQLSGRVEVKARDEVGVLGETFNSMAQAIEERTQELVALNESLDRRVRERTAELQRAHDALEQSNAEIKAAYERLRETQARLLHTEKMASLGRIVAGLAHEINNPLNFIYGNTGFLKSYVQKLQSMIDALEQRASLSGPQKEEIDAFKEQINYDFLMEDIRTLLDNFEEGARRIHSIVSDIRIFSGAEPGALRRADLNALLDDVIEELRDHWSDRIRLHRLYAHSSVLRCYPEKLRRAFFHLLSNAFKAIPGGGNVWIQTAAADKLISVSIRDDGVGIPQEHLGRIFDPFFTTRQVGQGAGLGLTVTYGVVEQHRGEIRIESEPGRGTTVTISLPADG